MGISKEALDRHTHISKRGMNQWMLAVHGSTAKGVAIDLKVVGPGPVSCHFFILFSYHV